MRSLPVLGLLTLIPSLASAQRLELTPIFGASRPLGGEMVLWVPIPVTAGFDSVAHTYTMQPGAVYGLRAEFRARGRLGFVGTFSVTSAERRRDTDPAVDPCETCTSIIYSGSLMATVHAELRQRLRLQAGVGAELLKLTGSAYTDPDFPPPSQVVVRDPSIGLLLGVGVSYSVARRHRVRLDAFLRRYDPKYEWRDASIGGPAFSQTAHSDLLLTLGWSFTPGG